MTQPTQAHIGGGSSAALSRLSRGLEDAALVVLALPFVRLAQAALLTALRPQLAGRICALSGDTRDAGGRVAPALGADGHRELGGLPLANRLRQVRHRRRRGRRDDDLGGCEWFRLLSTNVNTRRQAR